VHQRLTNSLKNKEETLNLKEERCSLSSNQKAQKEKVGSSRLTIGLTAKSQLSLLCENR
jgi:hypothetical protein